MLCMCKMYNTMWCSKCQMSFKYICSSPAQLCAVHLHSILLHVTVGIQWILVPVWAADKYSQNTVVAPAADIFVQLISVVIFECQYQHVFRLKLCVKYLQNFQILMAANYHTRNESNIIDLHEEAVVWFLHDYACYVSCGSNSLCCWLYFVRRFNWKCIEANVYVMSGYSATVDIPETYSEL